jgi:hypothetical protein
MPLTCVSCLYASYMCVMSLCLLHVCHHTRRNGTCLRHTHMRVMSLRHTYMRVMSLCLIHACHVSMSLTRNVTCLRHQTSRDITCFMYVSLQICFMYVSLQICLHKDKDKPLHLSTCVVKTHIYRDIHLDVYRDTHL